MSKAFPDPKASAPVGFLQVSNIRLCSRIAPNREGQSIVFEAFRDRKGMKRPKAHLARQPWTRRRIAGACAIAFVGTFVIPLGWLLTWIFFRTRKAGAALTGLVQALHGVNYALFPSASDQSMIDALHNYPVTSVAFEIAAGAVVGLIFYMVGATRLGRFLYDDAGGSAS